MDPDESHDLRQFGYEQVLLRQLGGFSSFALAFSLISVFTGVFANFGHGLRQVGGAVIWSWLIVLVGQTLVALVLAELATRMPLSGYGYQWTSRLVNPHLGFFVGWLLTLQFLTGFPGISATLATELGSLVGPEATQPGLLDGRRRPRHAGAFAVRRRRCMTWLQIPAAVLPALLVAFALRAAGGQAVAEDVSILPGPRPAAPSYESLARGPLRVRLFPGQDKPCLQHYIALRAGRSCANYIAAVEREGLSGSWAMMSLLPRDGLGQFIATGRPICCYFTMTAVQNHRLEQEPAMRAAMDQIERDHEGFYTFGVCEWENSFFRHWEQETDTTAIYGSTPAELGGMDRAATYEVVAQTARRWQESVRGRMMMATGYGMLSHLAEIGLDAVGIETSETIPATQVKRAFVRGAARQFGIPWFEEVSVWFGASVSGGMPEATILPAWPNTPVGGEAGHSASHLRRHWFTSWFGGVNHVMLEASPQVLFEVPWSDEFPDQPRLSRYGRDAQQLAALMGSVDIGVPYTPFAVLLGKHHGRWSVWGRPWGRLEETPGDRLTERFFDQLFSGQSRGPGEEERYLCSSPYGDTFDVLVNDADRTAWRGYPVILAVGDIAWTANDVRFLEAYVADGGILALGELHIAGWDRAFLGLAADGFAPTGDAQAVLTSSDGSPRVIRRNVGKGCVLVARVPQPEHDSHPTVPDELLAALADRFLPFKIEGDVQSLINRTPTGWLLMVVNNKGITKALHVDRAASVDPAAIQRVSVVCRGRVAAAELIAGGPIRTERNGDDDAQILRFDLPPGDIRLIAIEE